MKKIFLFFFTLFSISLYPQSSCGDCGVTVNYASTLGNFCPIASSSYSLYFEDNFDGTQLDLSKWNPQTGAIRNPNGEKEWYSSNNLVVENGMLKIKVKKEIPAIQGINSLTGQPDSFDYSSGEIDSRMSFGYGRYEIRCKIPIGKGFWPAFWMFGGGGSGIGNELDVFEFADNNFTNQQTTLHIWNNGANNACQNPCYGANNGFDYSQWHIYTLDWTPTYIQWLVDGVVIRVDSRYQDANTGAPVCNIQSGVAYRVKNVFPDPTTPVNIIANVAVQIGANLPDGTTPFPSEMDIDYIRFSKIACLGNLPGCYATSGIPSPVFQNLGGSSTQPVLKITNLNNCSTAFLEIKDISSGNRLWYNTLNGVETPINGYNVGISNGDEWAGFAYHYDSNGNIDGLTSCANGYYLAKLTVTNDCGTFIFSQNIIKVNDGNAYFTNNYTNGPKVPDPCCLYDLSIQNQTLTGNPLLYSVGYDITAGPAVNVPSGSNVTFNAGHAVHLNAGFSVSLGAVFNTSANPCTGFSANKFRQTAYDKLNQQEEQNTSSTITSTPFIAKSSSISVYPNPNNGTATIKMDNDLIVQLPSFSLFDMSGRKIFEGRLSETETSFDFSEAGINGGMYYYTISTSSGNKIKQDKFIIIQ